MLQLIDFTGTEKTAELPVHLQAMSTSMIMIDGPMAASMLTRNIEPEVGRPGTNRRSQPHLIDKYVDLILNDGWNPGHQGIAFDTEGFLVDGAHRLKAIVKADAVEPGIAVALQITINLPVEAMRDVDTVRRRSLSDRLTMKGYANSNIISAMGRITYLYANAQFDTPDPRYWEHSRPSRNVLEDFIDANRESMAASARIGTRSNLLTGTALAAAHWICTQAHPNADMATFLDQLSDGENIGRGNPVFALRRFAVNGRAKGTLPDTWEQVAFIIKAFAAHRQGNVVDTATFRPYQEVFPKP